MAGAVPPARLAGMSAAALFHPLFDADIELAKAGYAAIASNLAERFDGEVRRAILLILDFPDAFPRTPEGPRHTNLRSFPFTVLYETDGNSVLSGGLFHLHSDRSGWAQRLP